MSPAATEELRRILAARAPVAAARALDDDPARPVLVLRGDVPAGWSADGHAERPLQEHRAAHAAGTPSQAALLYGHGVAEDALAERLAGLAALAAETGLLREVWTVPAEGAPERPGSWGVEDLTVVVACRAALPGGVAVLPSWHHLGPAACQVAIAFGATGWRVPDDEDRDLAHLAAGIGRAVLEGTAGPEGAT